MSIENGAIRISISYNIIYRWCIPHKINTVFVIKKENEWFIKRVDKKVIINRVLLKIYASNDKI